MMNTYNQLLMSAGLLEGLFQEFYRKLIELRNQFKISPDPNAIPIIQDALTNLIQDQLKTVSTEDEHFARSYCCRLHYTMAAFADEIFINLDWDKSQEWLNSLLEEKLFNSHSAGTAIFEEIDIVLSQKTDTEIAKVYLYLLGLGFSGKYKNSPNYLTGLKKQLFQMIYRRAPSSNPDNFFPLNTVSGNQPSKQENWKYKCLGCFMIAMVLYTGITHIIWQSGISCLSQKETAQQGTWNLDNFEDDE